MLDAFVKAFTEMTEYGEISWIEIFAVAQASKQAKKKTVSNTHVARTRVQLHNLT